jgi:hypothetical protein
MSKHTPGPWIVARDMRGTGNMLVDGVVNAEGRGIANCGTNGEGNARLIAAAPDLLEALESLLNDQRDASLPALVRARAAIAKARGEA